MPAIPNLTGDLFPVLADALSDTNPWSGDLSFLLSGADFQQKMRTMNRMDAQRLCFTSLVSQEHFRLVSKFLESLRTASPEALNEPAQIQVDSEELENGDQIHNNTAIPWYSDYAALLLTTVTELDVRNVPDGQGIRMRAKERRQAIVDKRRRGRNYDPVKLEESATKLLNRFRLRFDDVRLLLTATGCAITGSSIVSLARPDLRVVPNDLDVMTGRGKGPAVADFFSLAACYEPDTDPVDYHDIRGIGPIWTLSLGGVLKINVIESLTDNPLDAIVRFHFSCVYAAWQADGIWLAYPESMRRSLVMTTPRSFPMGSGFANRFRAWSIFRKYTSRGFSVCLDGYPDPHVCGEDFNCPATIRAADDAGCEFYEFPNWRYTPDSRILPPTCWTMGGTGCKAGILTRNGENAAPVACSEDNEWQTGARAYVHSKTGPMPFHSSPDYLD
ncbi:hypothetical protein R3P38DRAFT_2764901 [Favolaschia claudopus]|uniref:Uncharacterized protein n=1 Tax=Favolaschia claudopus TaxID=2862362 RepID=A0AAW0D9E5_9AGAR